MILRSFLSLILLAILLAVYAIANLYGLISFLVWDHKIFRTLWRGTPLQGWGRFALQADIVEVVTMPWRKKL